MKSYGLLGVVFIVLFILEHVAPILLVTGMLLVVIDAYTMHSHYRETQQIYKQLLHNSTFISYLIEEDKEEDF
jgi:H+/Cl- antiporter ClcA